MRPGSDKGEIERLLRRCRDGDARAWDALVDRFSGLVASSCRKLRLSAEDSEDVFQNTFVALHQNLDRIESPETLPKWLVVTATRSGLRVIRSKPGSTTSVEPETLEDVLRSEDATAEQMAVTLTEADEVRQGLTELGGRCKELLGLLYGELQAAYSDVAEKLKMPVGAIGPTRARCLEKLKAILVQRGFFGE